MKLFHLRRELRRKLAEICARLDSDPVYEADEILRILYGLDRVTLLDGERQVEDPAPAMDAAARRGAGEPLGYVLGKSPFFGRDYAVGEGVLIPRADSEVLTEEALAAYSPEERGSLMDVCCGSGCLGISFLENRPGFTGVAVDVSPAALGYARQNMENAGMTARLKILQRDAMAEELPAGPFDLIFCNPPYITAGEMAELDEQVRREPTRALYGGEDGLDFYRRLTPLFAERLTPKGIIIYEIGWQQAKAVLEIGQGSDLCGRVRRDFGGHDRAVILSRKQ